MTLTRILSFASLFIVNIDFSTQLETYRGAGFRYCISRASETPPNIGADQNFGVCRAIIAAVVHLAQSITQDLRTQSIESTHVSTSHADAPPCKFPPMFVHSAKRASCSNLDCLIGLTLVYHTLKSAFPSISFSTSLVIGLRERIQVEWTENVGSEYQEISQGLH
jgi:hypothetical protein